MSTRLRVWFVRAQALCMPLAWAALFAWALVMWQRPLGAGAIGNALLIPLFFWISIPWHELGHVLFGRLVGMQIYRVQLGVGPRAWVTNIGGVKVCWHALPILGLTVAAPPAGRPFSRPGFWFTVLGGPVFSGMVAWAAQSLQAPGAGPALFPAHIGLRTDPIAVAGLVNLALCVFSLLPLRTAQIGSNDGWLLLSIPFASERVCREYRAAPWIAEAADAFWEDDVNRGRRACAAGLEAHPENASLRAMDASLALLGGRYQEARDAFVALDARAEENPLMTNAGRARLWNNIAWASVRLRDPELVAEADRYSQRALAILPKDPAAMGTRGTVLAALGRDGEARSLLASALALHTSSRSQAFNLSVLAILDARSGKIEDADHNLTAARARCPDCDLLDEAQAAIATARARPATPGGR